MKSERFARQTRFAPLGSEGQERLQERSALLVGCGALGGVIAQTLARAGVGRLVLVDRDVVEESNLPRQVLFDAAHAEERRPKVEAAAESLSRLGGPTRIETHPVQLNATNVVALAQGADILLDGTDNLATRYVLNDFAVREQLPWIYAGAVGSEGLAMAIQPGRSACLRCVFPEPAPAGVLDTCESAGVILPAVATIAALQSGLAMRLLAAPDPMTEALDSCLLRIDAWRGELQRLNVERDLDCPACARGEYAFLEAAAAEQPTVLCGRNTVELPAPATRPDAAALSQRLSRAGATDIVRAGSLLRFRGDGHQVTVFPDGRALVEGTDDPRRAQSLYDRFAG